MEFRELARDVGFTEGPTVLQDGSVVFVSVSQSRVYRHDGDTLSVLADVGAGPNGAREGRNGVVYVAQNGGEWLGGMPRTQRVGSARSRTVTGGVQAIERDGTVRFVSQDPVYPNDLCFGPDGFLYVTDPTRTPRRDDGRLWRIDVETGHSTLLASLDWYPNGIGFFEEDDCIYVAQIPHGRILRIPLSGDTVGEAEVFAELPRGVPDGFAWDAHGNLIVGGVIKTQPGELQVFDRRGRLQDVIHPGSCVNYTNVALSPEGDLYVTESDGGRVLRTEWGVPCLPLHPHR